MTVRAENRLLKTLEEPPVGTIIMILSENVTKLEQTIGISIKLTQEATPVAAPAPIGHKWPTGAVPTEKMKQTDENVKNLNFK